jgi:hypothetical protein
MRPGAGRALALLLALSCSSESGDPAPDGGHASGGAGGQALAAPYATEIVSFEPGDGAGFGEDRLPEVVLGAPHGLGSSAGSLHVLSLGKGGSIVLGFGSRAIRDGAGPDFLVFENAFWAGGDPRAVYAEPGEVSVSSDGEQWETFPCDPADDESGRFDGCAGVTPTLEYDPAVVAELTPDVTGGDAFDLAGVGLGEARYVRVRDRSERGASPTAGFDLDAVGIANASDVEP